MASYRHRLGVASMKALKKEIQDYKNSLNKATNSLVSDLVYLGTTELNRNMIGISNLDGNSPGLIAGSVFGTYGTITQSGPQIAYLEFGTGGVGQSNPHPQAVDAGWDYDLKLSDRAHRTRNGVEGWWYFNELTNESTFTPGIVANAQMFRTALYLRTIGRQMARRNFRNKL